MVQARDTLKTTEEVDKGKSKTGVEKIKHSFNYITKLRVCSATTKGKTAKDVATD